ncbi:MAG: AMP-binding protein, partial [Longimicrobiales bacterium]
MSTTRDGLTAAPDALRYAALPADLPRGTLTRLFFEAVDRDKPDALLRHQDGAWQPIPHRDILDQVRTLTHALQSRFGVKRGDRIALLSENRAEWLLADFAILCAGALTVPLYATLPANQLAVILRDCGATTVFVSNAEQLAKMRELQQQYGQVEHIIVMEDGAAEGDAIAWSAMLEEAHAGRPDEAA